MTQWPHLSLSYAWKEQKSAQIPLQSWAMLLTYSSNPRQGKCSVIHKPLMKQACFLFQITSNKHRVTSALRFRSNYDVLLLFLFGTTKLNARFLLSEDTRKREQIYSSLSAGRLLAYCYHLGFTSSHPFLWGCNHFWWTLIKYSQDFYNNDKNPSSPGFKRIRQVSSAYLLPKPCELPGLGAFSSTSSIHSWDPWLWSSNISSLTACQQLRAAETTSLNSLVKSIHLHVKYVSKEAASHKQTSNTTRWTTNHLNWWPSVTTAKFFSFLFKKVNENPLLGCFIIDSVTLDILKNLKRALCMHIQTE